MTIDRPVRPDNERADYQIDCEMALEDEFRALVDAAVQSGWRPTTVYAAMASLAENQRLAYAEDPDPADDPA